MLSFNVATEKKNSLHIKIIGVKLKRKPKNGPKAVKPSPGDPKKYAKDCFDIAIVLKNRKWISTVQVNDLIHQLYQEYHPKALCTREEETKSYW